MFGSMRILRALAGGFIFLGAVSVFAQSQEARIRTPRETDLSKLYYQPFLCGPIALFCICRQYDINTTIDELADLSGFQGRPIDVESLVRAAKAKGLEANPLNSSLRHLERIGGPAIIDLPPEHFCVFLGWKDDQAQIQDPPHPVRGVSIEELKEKWGRHLITFSLADKKAKESQTKQKAK